MKFRKNNLILLVSLVTLLTVFLPMQVKATPEDLKEYYPYAYVYMSVDEIAKIPEEDRLDITIDVMSGPSEASEVLLKLELGDVVEKRSTKGEWTKVITKNRAEGYVQDRYLKTPKQDMTKYRLVAAAVITKVGSSESRNFNIAKAASKINGLHLDVEELYDWFKVVGNANKANGYKIAPVIIKKKSAEGYGGGICQESTALYNTIYDIGIEPIIIYHHTLTSSYVKKGMDATIAYPKKNFTFKNTAGFPLMFESYAEDGQAVMLAYEEY